MGTSGGEAERVQKSGGEAERVQRSGGEADSGVATPLGSNRCRRRAAAGASLFCVHKVRVYGAPRAATVSDFVHTEHPGGAARLRGGMFGRAAKGLRGRNGPRRE